SSCNKGMICTYPNIALAEIGPKGKWNKSAIHVCTLTVHVARAACCIVPLPRATSIGVQAQGTIFHRKPDAEKRYKSIAWVSALNRSSRLASCAVDSIMWTLM